MRECRTRPAEKVGFPREDVGSSPGFDQRRGITHDGASHVAGGAPPSNSDPGPLADEESDAKRSPDSPGHAPMWRSSRALEELQVAGFCGIHTRCGPSPPDHVRARSKRDELDFTPQIDVFNSHRDTHGSANVLNPGPSSRSITGQPLFFQLARNQGGEGRGELNDRSPIEPVVHPESSRAAITKRPSCGCTEKLSNLGITWEMKMVPWSRRIGRLQP